MAGAWAAFSPEANVNFVEPLESIPGNLHGRPAGTPFSVTPMHP